ncbi:hypothetical protein MRX96_002908 [Rhipicephalus microplus]
MSLSQRRSLKGKRLRNIPKKQAEAEQCALSGLRSGERPSKAKAATPAKRITRKHRHLRRRKPKQPVNKLHARHQQRTTCLRLQGVVEELLLSPHGSTMERDRIAAVVRDRVLATPLPTAPHVGAWTLIAKPGVVPRATDDSAPSVRCCAPSPRYSCVKDLQSPEEFLERLENFCLVTGVTADKRLTHVVPDALEGGAKLSWRFVRGFNSWEQFTSAFRSLVLVD